MSACAEVGYSNGIRSVTVCDMLKGSLGGVVPNMAWRWCTHLLLVGKDSVVTTSREFHAEMLRPLYRHSMKIIMDSLVPNHRKKQLMPDRTMEPPGHETQRQ